MVLAVPNWSFGRDRDLLHRFEDELVERPLTVHFLASDVDHNRTVSAISGERTEVFEAIEALCELAFDRIDLTRHVGVHPRIGALDVCPFLSMDHATEDESSLIPAVQEFAKSIATQYKLPVFLYEKSEQGHHAKDLPTLRKRGFGGLTGVTLDPDFGPDQIHPLLGATVMGVRDFLVALNVNLATSHLSVAKGIASDIRRLREQGDPAFIGVRALGLPLISRDMSQVSMNLTRPNITPIDPVLEWVLVEASRRKCVVDHNELIGVIRACDLEFATRLPFKPSQVVDMR